ncbi:unnamed protein product [Rhizoctonia solani]|uniref:SMC hinge domain-containing protein n=1 Tax=Rhizoctonia solani TaxID=456999 RepID=A0A8H3HWS8_9AGAM|nr:unnamed protein product [Rhizoctonia solani]
MSAYVEIVFDNSDNRFPTGKDTVILRRTIGLKKDEYSLDKKSASKGDVMNLLESAGFSRSNPYYIVPQGRITSLTNAKDHERLALLKEVAGTKVYEQRRVESLKIMEETDAKRSKIAELLSYIATRLEELEGEKDELKEFHNADRERRCLEYALYTRELEDVANNLEQLEEERKQEMHAANTARTSFTQREEQLATFERQISSHKQTLAILGSTRPALRVDLADLTATRAKAQLAIQDLQERGEMGEQRREEMQTELEAVETRAAQVEANLAEIRPEWDEVIEQEKEEKLLMGEAQTRLGALHAKQGRISRFSSRSERDNYLRTEIKGLKTAEESVVQSLSAVEEEINSTKEKIEDLQNRAAESREQLQEKGNALTQLGEEIVQKNAKKAKLVEQRKELWREDTKYEQLVGSARDELHATQRTLAGMMDRDTGSGLRAVDRITEQLGLEGVYGPLYRLFEIPDKKYSTAIEQTAGNSLRSISLFHVVVDTDATAQKVLEVLQREKSGRVTFMPLNRLKPKSVPFPQAPDALPLIDRLQFDPLHRRAFEQVFGKTAVCENLQVAAAYVRSHGLNTITLEGDKVDRKGALTGGYHDVRRSRIETIRAVKHWTQKYEADSKILAEIKAQDAQLEQEITKLTGEIQVLTRKSLTRIRPAKDKTKPLTIKQQNLAALLESGSRAQSPTSGPAPLTHAQEQAALRDETISAFHNAVQEDGADDLLTLREGVIDDAEQRDEEYREFLQREVGEDISQLLWVEEGGVKVKEDPEPVTDERASSKEGKKKKGKRKERKQETDEEFLMNYILNRGWIDESENRAPTYKEVVGVESKAKAKGETSSGDAQVDEGGDLGNGLLDEDEFDEVADHFESTYNFRFEEPNSHIIATHPRNITASVRRTDTSRKEAREKKKERKAEKILAKKEEVKRLKALKMREIKDKLEKIRMEGGFGGQSKGKQKALEDDDEGLEGYGALGELDLDGDWDPDQHDAQMKSLYAEDGEYEDDRHKPTWDDDIDISDILPQKPASSSEDQTGKKKRKKRKHDEDGEDSGVDPDEMDAEIERPVQEEEEEEWDGTEEMRKRVLEKYMDEMDDLEFNDMVGDMPTHFRYAQVEPSTYGLTRAEIFNATDAELNTYMGLKRIAPYRKDKFDYRRPEKLRGFREALGARGASDHRKNDEPVKERKGKKERQREKAKAAMEEVIKQEAQAQEAGTSKNKKRKRKRKGGDEAETIA